MSYAWRKQDDALIQLGQFTVLPIRTENSACVHETHWLTRECLFSMSLL